MITEEGTGADYDNVGVEQEQPYQQTQQSPTEDEYADYTEQ